MKAKMVLMGGMGYPVTETPWGMPQLKKRLEAIGIAVWLGSWKDRQEAYDFAHGWEDWLGYAGDSLGAGSAAQYPADVKRSVQYVAGFQPSMYDARALEGHKIQVAANVIRAHAFYDPFWIDTAGLGYATYTPTLGAQTIVLNTEHRGPHPDDGNFGSYTQDIVFNEIKGQLQ